MNRETIEKEKQKNQEQKIDKKARAVEFLKRCAGGGIKRTTGLAKSFFDRFSNMLSSEMELGNMGTRARVKLFASAMALFVFSVFLSCTSMGEDCFPVAVAILCASGSKRRDESFTPRLIMALTLASVCISTLFMDGAGVLYFSVSVTLFVLRSVMTAGEFSEKTGARVLTSLAASFLIGIMKALISDFSLLSLVSWVTLITVTPILTFLFSPLFARLSEKELDTSCRERFCAGLLAVGFITVYTLPNVSFIGLSVKLTALYLVSAVISCRFSLRWGTVSGVVLGAALGEPVISAVVGISSGMAGLFSFDAYTVLVPVVISAVTSVFLGGSRGFLLVMPEILFSSLLLWPIISKIPRRERAVELEKNRSDKGGEAKRRLEKLSGAFSGLSEVFFAVSEGSVVSDGEKARGIVNSACKAVCVSCSRSAVCWGENRKDTEETLEVLSTLLLKKNLLSQDVIPEEFRNGCVHICRLCDAVNHLRSSAFSSEGIDAVNLIAGEYKTVSKLLKSTAENFASSPEKDAKAGKQAETLLEKLGIEFGYVEAWGGRNTVIDVIGVAPEKISLSAADIQSGFENAFSMKFEEPEFIFESGTAVLRMKRRRTIHLECAKNTCGKKGESTNGDSVSFFENDACMFYSLICDGMGSGHDAALTSRLASVFLEKLLSCMSDKKVSIEMLNRVLVNRDGEIFTTLDLVEIDLYEKSASFIKAGAAPSYVCRGGKVYTVASKTPPAGIISDLCAEETGIKLAAGDIIVLVSDGIADGNEDFPILKIIGDNRTLSPSDLSRKILSLALERFRARDDMSVAVIKVFED